MDLDQQPPWILLFTLDNEHKNFTFVKHVTYCKAFIMMSQGVIFFSCKMLRGTMVSINIISTPLNVL